MYCCCFFETVKNIQEKEEVSRIAQIELLENQYHYYEEKSEEGKKIIVLRKACGQHAFKVP